MQPIAADEMEREKNRSQHQRSKKYVKFASERANLDKGIVRTHWYSHMTRLSARRTVGNMRMQIESLGGGGAARIC